MMLINETSITTYKMNGQRDKSRNGQNARKFARAMLGGRVRLGWVMSFIFATLLMTDVVNGRRLNVLLVLVDDLRPEIASYGSKEARTPHLDKFSRDSVQFERAYAQEALCGPSRASIMTAKHPTKLNYFQHVSRVMEEEVLESSLIMPSWFQQNDYLTFGTSKIFHFHTNNKMYFTQYDSQSPVVDGRCEDRAVCAVDLPKQCTDKRALDYVLMKLENLREKQKFANQNWFMVVGFRRPHLPFRVPSSVLDKYFIEETSLPSDPLRGVPVNIPEQAKIQMCPDLRDSREIVNSGFKEFVDPYVEDRVTRKLRMGYLASVEWIDSLIGELLDAVDKTDTLIVITSDHAWSLGEHGAWCKGGLFEQNLRVPLWIRDPYSDIRGVKESTIVEQVGLFPTIAELAGVPLRASNMRQDGIQGRSYANLIRKDVPTPFAVEDSLLLGDHIAGHSWSFPVSSSFAVWPVCRPRKFTTNCRACFNKKSGAEQPCSECSGDDDCQYRLLTIHYMGLSVRTDRYRYTEWRKYDMDNEQIQWDADGLDGQELYDHQTESGRLEIENEGQNNRYRDVVEAHAKYLRARHLDCADADTSETLCESYGDHCVFLHGRCYSRSFCGYTNPTICDAVRRESCTWNVDKDRCENRYRVREIITHAPTGRPTTRSPTERPTSQPTEFQVPTERPTRQPLNTKTPTSRPTKSPKTPRPTSNDADDPCAKVVGTRKPPKRKTRYWKWKKKNKGECLNISGCTWVGSEDNCFKIS